MHPTKEGLTMGEVLKEINAQSKGEAAIVSDVGQHQMIACRYAELAPLRGNITSGGLGTMGFALPAAIGAKMATPEREVVAVIGDGGYQMTIQELGTIFQTKAAKIVVLNNDFLGMVRQWQQLFFDKRYASTVMTNPDFVTIAKGYQIEAKRAMQKREELSAAVEEMMTSKEAYFLEVCGKRG